MPAIPCDQQSSTTNLQAIFLYHLPLSRHTVFHSRLIPSFIQYQVHISLLYSQQHSTHYLHHRSPSFPLHNSRLIFTQAPHFNPTNNWQLHLTHMNSTISAGAHLLLYSLSPHSETLAYPKINNCNDSILDIHKRSSKRVFGMWRSCLPELFLNHISQKLW